MISCKLNIILHIAENDSKYCDVAPLNPRLIPHKTYLPNFPTPKNPLIENFEPRKILRSSLSLQIRNDISPPPRAGNTSSYSWNKSVWYKFVCDCMWYCLKCVETRDLLSKTKAVHVRFKTMYISGKKNIGKGKRWSLHTSLVAHTSGAYPCFRLTLSDQGSIATPPGLDASPSQYNPPAFRQVSLTVRRYPFIVLLGGERHCESELSCPKTQHNDPARTRNRTSRSRVQRDNH